MWHGPDHRPHTPCSTACSTACSTPRLTPCVDCGQLVELVELDPIGWGANEPPPDDPFFNQQCGLENEPTSVCPDRELASCAPDADVDILGAWCLTQGDPSITVALLDTGIDFGHLGH